MEIAHEPDGLGNRGTDGIRVKILTKLRDWPQMVNR
jgi:hypothetical protein